MQNKYIGIGSSATGNKGFAYLSARPRRTNTKLLLQYITMYYNILQHITIYYNILQYITI